MKATEKSVAVSQTGPVGYHIVTLGFSATGSWERQIPRAEACSGENVGDTCRVETTFLKSNLAEAELLAEACPNADERGAQSRGVFR